MGDPTIDTVDTVALHSELAEPFGYAQSWVKDRTALLVRIEADDGTVGWGECWGPIWGTRETVDEFLGPIVEGRSPLAVERIYEDLYRQSRAAYQSVVPLPAISGIDIALWDLKGKLLDVPVHSLLGGARRSAVRAYATGHYFKHEANSPEEQYERITAEAERNAERFGAVKAKIGLQLLGYGADEDIELARRIRQAVGADTTLMVDANYAYDVGTAIEVGNELEALDAHWFEEPVPPERMDGYRHLREKLDLRIAGGECHTPAEFGRLIETGALDIAQPDVCNVGGLTAASQVRAVAQNKGVQVVPHVWGTPIAIAASLHFIATLAGRPWLEFDQSSNPLRDQLAIAEFDVDDGRVGVPDGPGLGIELDQEVVEAYRVD